jgi:hypothetical protein
MTTWVILVVLLLGGVFGGCGVALLWGWFRRRNWEVLEGKVYSNTRVRGDESGSLYRPEIEVVVDGELVRYSPESYRQRSEAEIGEARRVLRNPKTGELWEGGNGFPFETVMCLAIGAFLLVAAWWLAGLPPTDAPGSG